MSHCSLVVAFFLLISNAGMLGHQHTFFLASSQAAKKCEKQARQHISQVVRD
jgi:hypothetical protein